MTAPAERGRRALWRHRVVRFITVGIFNTATAYAIYALFLLVGLHYALANLLALVLSVLIGFVTQGRWVFGNTDPRRFGRFVACWTAIYGVNVAFIKALLILGANAYVAGAIATVPVAALSYLVQRFFVFMPARPG